MTNTPYEKLRTKVFGILDGLTYCDPCYFNIRKLVYFAESVHSHFRRDGSKEFSHQLEMLALALNFHALLINPYEVYMAIIVHDILEDYPEQHIALERLVPGALNYSARLNKFEDSDDKSYYGYFEQLADCPICSVVKLIDRVHNLSTAPGVFSTEKLISYCDEVDEYFFTMCKNASMQFSQREVYEILKTTLKIQVKTIRALTNE